MPNGELRPGRTGAILAGMGVKPGVADLVLVLPGGRPGFLELKSRKGRLSPAQKGFREAALAAGALYEVARSTDEAIAVLTGWGAVRVSGKGRAACAGQPTNRWSGTSDMLRCCSRCGKTGT